MGYKRTLTDPNELNNEEAMESMFKVTGIIELDLDKYPQDTMNNKIGNFDEANINNAYAWAQ